MLHNVILVLHVLIAASLVGLVLLQQGKGADVGAAFGSGASSTVFGSQGSASFLTRTTGILAALFFVTSLSLAYLATRAAQPTSVLDTGAPPAVEQVVEETAPVPSELEQPVPVESQAAGEPATQDVPVTD
ncbi:MAG: preprotein translocase subunit SecG [Pseudomonadota bacterium]|nr:MAG: preprotein translocase subunit SecG [Pseudomonadota bacterium]